MRPPRGADGAAGRTEPGAMRGRSRLERAAAQYTAGAGGAAVGPALARGAGRARAVRATERRRAGCGLPSMGSGRRWRRPGVAAGKTREGLGCIRMVATAMGSSRVVRVGHGDEPTFFSFFSFFSPFSRCRRQGMSALHGAISPGTRGASPLGSARRFRF